MKNTASRAEKTITFKNKEHEILNGTSTEVQISRCIS